MIHCRRRTRCRGRGGPEAEPADLASSERSCGKAMLSFFMRSIWLTPAALAGRTLVRALASTYRLRDKPTTKQPSASLRGPAIFAWWHDQIATGLPLVLRLRRQARVTILASHSRDGELVTRAAVGLGLVVARGSSSRGGQAGLRALHRAVRSGCSPLLLPDGPRGPQYAVKPGIVVLAQVTGLPIVPIGFDVRAPWHLSSWDRMQIPRPGSRIEVFVGETISVPRQLSDAARDACCLAVKEALMNCRQESDRAQ